MIPHATTTSGAGSRRLAVAQGARPLAPAPPRATHSHAAELQAPFYQDGSGAVALHRYLEPGFVDAFNADVQALAAGGLAPGAHFAWQQEDRFAGIAATCLRHPITGTFYLVSVEAVCGIAGKPALDPKRIRSAGFVVRRCESDGSTSQWLTVRGAAVGWQPTEGGDLDPDHDRRATGVSPTPAPPYTGEQTHPLQPQVVSEAGGRAHTILSGYLPVGGGAAKPVARPGAGGSIPADQLAGLRQQLSGSRAWPFGTPARTWADGDGELIASGVPTRDFFKLLADLVHRHRLGIVAGGDNAALEAALADWQLVRTDLIGLDQWLRPVLQTSVQGVMDWLRAQLAPLASDGASALHDLLGRQDVLLGQAASGVLPGLELGGSIQDWTLSVGEAQAAALRGALLVRDLAAIDATVGGAPLPRFSHADDERFVVVPFVRWAGAACTHVAWGRPSAPFRVASPYDPEAGRPRVVALPSLKDLKRGLLGAHFLAPRDLAEKLLSVGSDGLKVSKQGGAGLGLCWSFSFSLPAITICAMIVLSIIIGLLNIIFFWLPWVFLKLPSFCLKKP